MKSFKIYILIIIAAFPVASFAQLDISMQQLSMTHQRSYTNPALVPDVKLHIGLPALSYINGSLSNSGFKGKDFFTVEGETLTLGFGNMIDELKDKNSFATTLSGDLFSMGFKTGSGYFSMNITEKFKSNFSYPKDFFEFIYYGNGAVLGEEMSFDFGLNMLQYSEIGLGYTQSFKDKLYIGAKFKYYVGRLSVETNEAYFNITTAKEDFTLRATSSVDINTSYLNTDEVDHYEFRDVMTGNRGFGFDAGAVYKLNEKIQFSASVIDLGYIKWFDNVTNYKSKNKDAEFIYSGIDLETFFSDSTSFEDDMEVLQDSLFRLFDIDETNVAYKQSMPTQAYLGAKFKVTNGFSAGITAFAEKYKEQLYPGISVYGQAKLRKMIDFVVSYTIYRNSFTNVGLGGSLNLGPIQFYALSNNALGWVMPSNSNNFDLKLGMNLTFGRRKGFGY